MKTSGLAARVGFWIVPCCLLGAGLGAGHNALMSTIDRHMAGIPGKRYAVNGASMHLYCTGQGSPALILDTGLGDNFTVWAKAQPALSTVTRVCSFDRPGFGWSDSRSGMRDADTISTELHQLLAVAGVQMPVGLVGHSIAGLHLRAYANRYPAQLAGLVFIDAATPRQDDRIPPSQPNSTR